MIQSSKAPAQQLASDIQRSTSPEAIAVKEIARLLFEEAKNSLVTAQGDDLHRQQGAAQAFERLLKMLTRPSPTGQEQ